MIEWPTGLVPRRFALQIINNTRSAGESVTGFEQVAATLASRWSVSLEFGNLKRAYILPFRAMIASLRGRSNALRLPVFDTRLQAGDGTLGGESAFSDGSHFSDGADFVNASDVTGITVTASIDAATITADFGANPLVLEAGQYFGLGDEPYIATAVSWVGTVATITVEPPLVKSYTAAAFTLRPTIIARLADDMQGQLLLDMGIVAAPSLELIQILPDELEAWEL